MGIMKRLLVLLLLLFPLLACADVMDRLVVRHGGSVTNITGSLTNVTVDGESITNLILSPTMLGAAGDGVTDDTVDVNEALAGRTSVFLPDTRSYLVTSLTNPYGSAFAGAGKILQSVTYGTNTDQRQLNSYGDVNQLVFGREYLSHAHKRLIAGSAVKIVFTGDSTTAGDSATTPYRIWELVPEFAQRRGLSLVTGENRGQSGKTAAEWVSTYLAGDLALSPNVLVVRWGINDPYFGRTAVQAIDSIRSGLATIRATYGVDDMTVVLMSPNSTNDEPNDRDPRYYEELVRGLRTAARDYQCVFLDTYATLRDSFNAADWMDDPFGDGRHIHPNNVMNAWISTLISDVLFPVGLTTQIGLNQNVNVTGAEETKTPTDAITTYPYGMSQYRAFDSPLTWPFDGVAVTFKGADGTALQFNYPYQGTANYGAMRFYKTGSVNAWTSWRTFGDMNVSGTAATPLSTDAATTYPYGTSIYRATSSAWPFDGQVVTSRHIDGAAYQIAWSYTARNIIGLAQFRIWRTAGPLANAWSEWVTLGEINIGATAVEKIAADAISTYPMGLSQFRGNTNFPLNGVVLTAKNIDGPSIQFNYPFAVTDASGSDHRIAVRQSASGTWQNWNYLSTHQASREVFYSGTTVSLQCNNGPDQTDYLTATNNFTLDFYQVKDKDGGVLTVFPAATNVTVTLPSYAYGPSGSTLTVSGGTGGTNYTEIAWKAIAVGGTNLVTVNALNYYR
jgi:hypothetical protein